MICLKKKKKKTKKIITCKFFLPLVGKPPTVMMRMTTLHSFRGFTAQITNGVSVTTNYRRNKFKVAEKIRAGNKYLRLSSCQQNANLLEYFLGVCFKNMRAEVLKFVIQN